MDIKSIIRILVAHFVFFVLGTVLFVVLFHTKLFGDISVFFYRGIALLVIASLLITSVLLIFKKTRYGVFFTFRDVVLSVTLIFCVNLVFFTHVPVTADRSVSVFLLGYMSNHSDDILTKEEITQVFIDKYLYENDGVDKRFNEQMISGNVVREGNGFRISERGKFVMRVYNIAADLFGIDKRNISP